MPGPIANQTVVAPTWSGGEDARLEALQSYHAETLHDDEELKSITDFAARLCDTPTALVSLVGDSTQDFIARTGLEARSTPRSQSFCAHAMLGFEAMVVTDAASDPRFADNPLVTGPPNIRFYAGMPLTSRDGVPLGSLCVIGPDPRPEGLTDFQREGLGILAQAVMRRLKSRRDEIASREASDELEESERRFAVLADTMPQMVWSTRPDGYHDYYNARWYEYTGMPVGSTDGAEWNGMFHPDDQERAWARWRHSLDTGEPYEIEYRLRNAEGEYRWTLGRALPIRGPDGAIIRWFGTCTDIHDRKEIEQNLDLLSRELEHRIKNIFSVVGGIAGLTARENPESAPAFRDFTDRMAALSRAYDFATDGAAGGSLKRMLEGLFLPYRAGGQARINLSGEDLKVSEQAASALSLLFHELATNAVKYGALKTDEGSVDLVISRDDERVRLHWKESGGPRIKDEDRAKGFGSALIETTVVRQLRGTIDRDWPEEGLCVEVSIPAERLA